MKIFYLLGFIVILLEIQCSFCFVDPVSIAVGSAGVGLLTAGYQKFVKCRISECCNDDYIPINIRELQMQLNSRLHGQHIVIANVIGTFRGYKRTEDPPKALVMSFHGTPGVGKNFAATIISEMFYKKGRRSQYYHFFSGSTFSAARVDQHKEMIKKIIISSLKQCERSMFVFDEVHVMPEGLLDVIYPFIDYNKPTFVEQDSEMVQVISNKSIFIFLSNVAGMEILKQTIKLRQEGKTRESMTLADFEKSIADRAHGEEGGFLNSNAIKSSLIDFYIPFLPLEHRHVIACMKDAFASRSNQTQTALMEEEVMASVTWFEEPPKVYSKSGCKRIEQKVISSLVDV